MKIILVFALGPLDQDWTDMKIGLIRRRYSIKISGDQTVTENGLIYART